MATKYSDTANGNPARSGTGPIKVPFAFAIGSASVLAIDDVIVLAKLPKYSTLLGFVLELPDCGDAGTVHIGTLSDADRFTVSAVLTTAKRISSYDAAATANTHVLLDALPFRVLDVDAGDTTVEDDFRLTATVALTVPVAATIKGFVEYVCNEVQASAEVRAS